MCITENKNKNNKIIFSHYQLSWWCPSRSHVCIHSMPFCVTEIVQFLPHDSTYHEYSLIQNPKATRVVLITMNTLDQLDLLGKKKTKQQQQL